MSSVLDKVRDLWADGGWKVRVLMGGGVFGGVFLVVFLVVALVGGGGDGGGDVADVAGVEVGEDGVMVFDDEEAAAAEAAEASSGGDTGGGGSADAGENGGSGGASVSSAGELAAVEDAVAATIEAMFPTEEPTLAPDYVATLEAGLHRSRAGSNPLSLSPLDPSRDKGGGLTEAEIELLGQYGVYFWDMLQAWVVVRSVLFSREVYDWERRWLEEQVELVRWLMPERGFWTNQGGRSAEGVGDVVKAYLDEVRNGEEAVRQSVSALDDAVTVFERAGVERFRDLGPEDAEEVYQLSFDADAGVHQLGSVMSAYGCSICGELYRASGTPVRSGQ